MAQQQLRAHLHTFPPVVDLIPHANAGMLQIAQPTFLSMNVQIRTECEKSNCLFRQPLYAEQRRQSNKAITFSLFFLIYSKHVVRLPLPRAVIRTENKITPTGYRSRLLWTVFLSCNCPYTALFHNTHSSFYIDGNDAACRSRCKQSRSNEH